MTPNRGLAALAALLGLGALSLGDSTGLPGGPASTTALETARELRRDPESVVVLDLRDYAAYAEFHLPRARHAPFAASEGPMQAEVSRWLESVATLELPPQTRIVVGSNSEAATREAWLALRRSGYSATYMPDMIGDWVNTIVSPVRAPTSDPVEITQWSEISGLSRYFGGLPRVVDRPPPSLDANARLRLARRRGCAF